MGSGMENTKEGVLELMEPKTHTQGDNYGTKEDSAE